MRRWGGKRRPLRRRPPIGLNVMCKQQNTLTSPSPPPSLAEAINAKGFSGAAGFRIVAVEPGRAEVALARRDDLVQFFGHFHGGAFIHAPAHGAPRARPPPRATEPGLAPRADSIPTP